MDKFEVRCVDGSKWQAIYIDGDTGETTKMSKDYSLSEDAECLCDTQTEACELAEFEAYIIAGEHGVTCEILLYDEIGRPLFTTTIKPHQICGVPIDA